jgi:hypothetical protein
VAKLSHAHDAILNWLLLNPCCTLREASDSLGYSVPWLSRLIHTDIFQAELQARQGEVFVGVTNDIPAKLRGLADIAIEKVTEHLLATEEPQYALDVFDKTLTKLGYAPQSARNPGGPSGGTVQNVFMVSPSDLAQARQMFSAPPPQGVTYDSASEESPLGAILSVAAPVQNPVPAQGQESPGRQI